MSEPELYGSHLPVLTRVVELTNGPILELGMGLYSTPFLHTMAELQERQLVSLDNDPKWFNHNLKWRSNFHMVAPLVTDWEKSLEELADWPHWSVALVDEKPAKHRMRSIKFLAKRANFVIIHDSEPESDKFFKYTWVYKLYKYKLDYTKLRPFTTVLSNFVDLKFIA